MYLDSIFVSVLALDPHTSNWMKIFKYGTMDDLH